MMMKPHQFRDRAPRIAQGLYLGFGALYLVLGLALGLRGVLMAWLGVSLLVMGVSYSLNSARLLGKRSNGTFHPLAMVVHWVYLFTAWAAWKNRRIEDAWNEVAPGIFVGRMAPKDKFPPGVTLAIDMTCELLAPMAVRESEYRCLPTLDGTAPSEGPFRALVAEAAKHPGPVFVFCAAGHGRSATMAAAIIVARGLAKNADEAEAMMQAKRPHVGLGAAQRALVHRTAG